ncbi:hypothetical protein V5799_005737 [Amblyomma americanum]|uniref:Single domain-containing protein n=1 Tax=Amblyomma americanum TaxID=6943 RepID=A0AAQ4DYD8_AMBAM
MIFARSSGVSSFVATILLVLVYCVDAAYRVKVSVVGGNCVYDGNTIPPWKPVSLQNPCENVQCMLGKQGSGNIVVTECSQLTRKLLCGLKNLGGRFPYCCQRPSCP